MQMQKIPSLRVGRRLGLIAVVHVTEESHDLLLRKASHDPVRPVEKKLSPNGPVFPPCVGEGSMTTLIAYAKESRIDTNNSIDDLVLRGAMPTRVVKGRSTAVVPDADGHMRLLQQERDGAGISPPAGHVNE